MKGQLEYAILLVIVIVAVIVIGLVYQSVFYAPPGSEEHRLVQDAVTNIIREGSSETIRLMELHGGYMEPSQNSVAFAGTGAAYWQSCQSTDIPQPEAVKQRLSDGLRNYVLAHKDGLASSFPGTVELGEPVVSVNILGNRIDFTVNMPTKVKGTDIRQSYTVSMPTRFGEIYEFASNFADSSSRERYLDEFTKVSLYLSRDLPTSGAMTSCGERISLSRSSVESGLEGIIDYTLTHISLWEKPAAAGEDVAVYFIDNVNGRKYPGMDISFILPNSFDMVSGGPIKIKNDKEIYSDSFPLPIPICLSTYHITYDVTYPVIVSVRDDLTGYSFNFATLVNLDDNEPSACEPINIAPYDECGSLECRASIVVKSTGGPLPGARAFFGDCEIGASNSAGVIEGPVKCGENSLEIFYSEGYETIEKQASHEEISGTYTLRKIPMLNFSFMKLLDSCQPQVVDNEVITIRLSSNDGLHIILNTDPDSVTGQCSTATADYIRENPEICLGGVIGIVPADSVPPGTYKIYTSTLDIAKIQEAKASASILDDDIAWHPVESHEADIIIGEENRTINVLVRDPAVVYAKAIEIGESQGIDAAKNYLESGLPGAYQKDEFRQLLARCGEEMAK